MNLEIENFLNAVRQDVVDYDFALSMGGDLVAASKEDPSRALTAVVETLPALTGLGRAMAFLVCGALVENGARYDEGVVTIADQFCVAIAPASRYMDACKARGIAASPDCECAHDELEYLTADMEYEEAELDPEGFEAWQLLDFMGRGVLAIFLASGHRGPWSNELLAAVDGLARYDVTMHYLRAYLRLVDSPIVVIDPAQKKGVKIHPKGTADVFQLHTLLADIPELRFGEMEGPSQDALDVVAGLGPVESEHVVLGPWQMQSWRALAGDLNAEETTHWIWNEALPHDIPQLDDTRVIVLLEAAYPRTWTASRLFESVPASIEILEMFGEAEVDRWINRAKEELSRP